MELNGLFPIIRRWLAVILTATAMATLVGFLLGSAADKTYEARTEVLVGPLSTDSNTMRASGDLSQTYAQLATTANILDVVAEDLDVDRDELSDGVRATANSTTRLLTIRARSHDPETAADVANGVVLQLITLGSQDPTRPEGRLTPVDKAFPPSDPVSPRLDLIIPLAAVAGLLGSMTLVLLFEFVGDTAESVEKVEEATGSTTLAVKRRTNGPGPTDGPGSDPVRVLATQAGLARPDVRCILVTGVARQDGTGALAIELAEVLGRRYGAVIVVDAGAGEVTDIAGQADATGLSEMLAQLDVTDGPKRWNDTVEVLGTGGGGEAEAIQIDDARLLIHELTGDRALVLVHAPPATISAATLVWAQAADVTILVARRFQTRRGALVEAATNLRTAGAELAFAVLHDAPRSRRRTPRARAAQASPSPDAHPETTPPASDAPVGATGRPS